MSRNPHVSASPIRTDQGRRGNSVDTDAAVGVTSYLLAGPLAFGGIGYGLDRWLGTHVLVAVGILVGLAVSLYIVWLRYGAGGDDDRTTTSSFAPGASRGSRHEHAPTASTTHEESQ